MEGHALEQRVGGALFGCGTIVAQQQRKAAITIHRLCEPTGKIGSKAFTEGHFEQTTDYFTEQTRTAYRPAAGQTGGDINPSK